MAYTVITTNEELGQVLAFFGPVQPERPKIVALDTEFKQGVKKAGRPTALSLVQLQVQDSCFLIDVLSRRMTQSAALLGAWLARPDIIIVVHAAKGDLDALYAHTGSVPRRLFDTQLAVGLSGGPTQIGLKGALDETLGMDFPKNVALQRCDWMRRPLTAAQLEYASLDVRYLLELVAVLQQRLAAMHRFEWAEQESAQTVREFSEKVTGAARPALTFPVPRVLPQSKVEQPLLALAFEETAETQKGMLDAHLAEVAGGLAPPLHPSSLVPRKHRDLLMSCVERCVYHECAPAAAAAAAEDAEAAAAGRSGAWITQMADEIYATWTPWRQQVLARSITPVLQHMRLLVLQKYREIQANPPPPQEAPAEVEEKTPEAVVYE